MRRTQAARREGRGIRLAHDKLLARELEDRDPRLASRREEGIVLLGRDAGQRQEPMRVVRRALFNGPLHHRLGDNIGGAHRDLPAVLLDIENFFKNVLGKTLSHDLFCKNIRAEARRQRGLVVANGLIGGQHSFHSPFSE